MSTLSSSIMPRSLKGMFAALAACAVLASTPAVAPAAANATSKPCDEKDIAKGKDKCDPFGGDGRKN
jgi:hypothetical protein